MTDAKLKRDRDLCETIEPCAECSTPTDFVLVSPARTDEGRLVPCCSEACRLAITGTDWFADQITLHARGKQP